MGSYTIISDIGNLMVNLLKEHMVPEIIVSADAIGQCSPTEKENMALGLYLYDVRESGEIRLNGMQQAGVYRQTFPPMYLELYYMLTAYSMSDTKFRAAEEQRILGRAMQLFHDHPTILLDSMTFGTASVEDSVRIEMISMDAAEKMKLWSFPNVPYRLSLLYKVSPVPMDSTRSVPVKRVREMEFSVKEYQVGKEPGNAAT